MFPRRSEPFPIDAARDLLGILRALYRAIPAREVVRRRRVAAMGESLKTAIELGSCAVGSMGNAAAWARAEEVCRDLFDVVDVDTTARQIVEAAVARANVRRTANR